MKLAPLLVPLLLVVLGNRPGSAQTPAASGPAGHWEGSITLPATALGIRVDLARSPDLAWSGTIDIPVQGLRGFALGNVAVKDSAVSFAMPGIPGDPAFAGQLDAEGQVLSGDFTQGGLTFAFKLERKTRTATAGETPVKGVPGTGLAGVWQGSLRPTPVIELRVLLEITNAPGGGLEGAIVSLDQGQSRMPVTKLTEKAGEVRLEATNIGGSFQGQMARDGSEIAGTWRQSGQSTPLVFKRIEKAPDLRRPQEPKKPYPYREEAVAIEHGGLKLAGTLTLPPGRGPHTAVVLITGSGPEDRDEAILGHRPFLVLADYLTRRGIAVLRCDDRGVGASTGTFATATQDDFVEDALAAVGYLRTRTEVDPKRIGLVGHSEGGIVAPLAAVKSPDVAFIVLLAGVGVPAEELLVRQGRDIARVMGASEETLARNEQLQRATFRIVREEPDRAVAEEKLRRLFREQLASLTEEQRKALGLSDAMLEGQIKTVLTPWFRRLIAYDPRPTLKAVKCPVLALNGEKDLQVAAKANLGAIREALTAGGNRDVKTVELPGLNHLFQACQTGAVAEYAQIEETFNPAALKAVSDWIDGLAGR